MESLDQWISQLGNGPASVLLVAVLLGLRHATDPDHVAAVSTLVLGNRADGAAHARTLGLAWGAGHGTTLFLFGLPIVLFRKYLPPAVHTAAELAIAAIIIGLAIRLLIRWRRGYFHVHPHQHDGVLHAHPHMHEQPGSSAHPELHGHRHAEAIGRTPLTAFSVGLVHGIGGSAGAGVLLVSAAPTAWSGVAALLLFALGTALSMALLTSLLGALLGRGRVGWLVPALGILSLCFGIWYGMETLPW
jgi:ABC-type nickel/cobalt efflux system permease component RcnA